VVAELLRDARCVASQRVWRHMCGAYVLYTAVLGVYAFWGPKAGKAIYGLQGETADLVFGCVTVVTGVAGSLIGGLTLDWLGATLENASLVCGAAPLLGLVLLLPAFLVTRSFGAFVAMFAAGELALFSLQAPVAALGMWCVPAAQRPLAISMVTVCIHLLGDVPSPPLVGALQSALEAGKTGAEAAAQWRVSMSAATTLLLASGCVFLRCARVARGARDYRSADELDAVAGVAEAHRHLHHHHHHQQQQQQCDEEGGARGHGAAAAVLQQQQRSATGLVGGSSSSSSGVLPERQPLLVSPCASSGGVSTL
jgi:hypothetical protein